MKRLNKEEYTKSEPCIVAYEPLFHKDRFKARELNEDSLPMTMKEAGICVYTETGHREKGDLSLWSEEE